MSASGETWPVSESIEGTPVDDWPPSPALQSLSFHMLPDGRQAALLVGMAGSSHWSASIEPCADEPRLRFDIACRHSRRPERLGSQYQLLDASAHGRLIVEFQNKPVDQRGGVLVIEPVIIADAGTSRWQYTIGIAP